MYTDLGITAVLSSLLISSSFLGSVGKMYCPRLAWTSKSNFLEWEKMFRYILKLTINVNRVIYPQKFLGSHYGWSYLGAQSRCWTWNFGSAEGSRVRCKCYETPVSFILIRTSSSYLTSRSPVRKARVCFALELLHSPFSLSPRPIPHNLPESSMAWPSRWLSWKGEGSCLLVWRSSTTSSLRPSAVILYQISKS